MKNALMTIWIIVITISAGFAIGAATTAGILIPAAIPFSLVLIGLLALTVRRAEKLAWATVTVGLLAGTYLQTGDPIEYAILGIYLVLAALGIIKSPYFLAVAWLFHPVWDFIPRTLPPQMTDLPMACVLFDIPIGLYLLWSSWKKRWPNTEGDVPWPTAWKRTGKVFMASGLMLGGSYAVAAAAGTGFLSWVGLCLAVVIIAGFRVLGPRGELIAWAVLTGWLGMTYAHTGGMLDATVFLLYVLVSVGGYFISPWLLPLAWLAFIPWSFMPHHLTQMYTDFAPAAVFYCLPVCLYLLWAVWTRRWSKNI